MGEPPISDAASKLWCITSARVIADTPGSLVSRVVLEDGSTAIVKSLKPRGLGELPGMAFLTWCDGQGAVRLLAQAGTTSLLEDAGSVTLREHRLAHGEAAAIAIIVDVLRRLHRHDRASPEGLTPLHDHFQPLFACVAREMDEGLAEPLRFCATLAERLLADQRDVRPLHGDLHHDNIVCGSGRGWLAIDPQGLIGDAAYDVANIFGNPLNALADIVDPDRIRTLCATFSSALARSERTILHYALAHAGLSIAWSLEDGMPFTESENAQERLAFITVARALL